jgi:hypothetical protein
MLPSRTRGLVDPFSHLQHEVLSHVYVVVLQQFLGTKATRFVNAPLRHVACVKAEA